jgi:hypothetical protein
MRTTIILLVAALLMSPGILTAQMMHRGEHMGGPGMSQCGMQNMDMINQMTGEMNQMMAQGHMTAAQHEEMKGMMSQMGQMKQQLSASMTPQMEQQQHQQLMEMQQRWNTIKSQMK